MSENNDVMTSESGDVWYFADSNGNGLELQDRDGFISVYDGCELGKCAVLPNDTARELRDWLKTRLESNNENLR